MVTQVTQITRFEDIEVWQSACEVARKSNQQSTIINQQSDEAWQLARKLTRKVYGLWRH